MTTAATPQPNNPQPNTSQPTTPQPTSPQLNTFQPASCGAHGIRPTHSRAGGALSALRDLHANPRLGLTRIVRAWPGPKGDLHAEAIDTDQHIRALHITPHGDITLLPYAIDPRLPSLIDELSSGCLVDEPTPQGRLAVHRYGKRAVTLSDSHVRKHLRAGKSAPLARAWQTMADLCAQAHINTPAITRVDEHSITFDKAPGRTLHDLADDGMPGWEAFAERWTQLTHPTNAHPTQTTANPHRLTAYTPRDEAHTLNTWLAHATQHSALPEAAHISRSVDTTTAQLLDDTLMSPINQWVTTHRDLHDKQLLWDGHALTLLDMDTAVCAEAALDIANLRAHIDLRITQGRLNSHMRAPLMELTSRIAHNIGITQQRLHTYECASRLRLACVYAFRPTAAPWLPAWIDHTLATTTIPYRAQH